MSYWDEDLFNILGLDIPRQNTRESNNRELVQYFSKIKTMYNEVINSRNILLNLVIEQRQLNDALKKELEDIKKINNSVTQHLSHIYKELNNKLSRCEFDDYVDSQNDILLDTIQESTSKESLNSKNCLNSFETPEFKEFKKQCSKTFTPTEQKPKPKHSETCKTSKTSKTSKNSEPCKNSESSESSESSTPCKSSLNFFNNIFKSFDSKTIGNTISNFQDILNSKEPDVINNIIKTIVDLNPDIKKDTSFSTDSKEPETIKNSLDKICKSVDANNMIKDFIKNINTLKDSKDSSIIKDILEKNNKNIDTTVNDIIDDINKIVNSDSEMSATIEDTD